MTVITDSKKRIVLKPAKPGDRFDFQICEDGSYRLRLLEPVESKVPLVSPVRTSEGFIMVPRKLDRRMVAAAIRADRDSR
jgi:hypothetical protein